MLAISWWSSCRSSALMLLNKINQKTNTLPYRLHFLGQLWGLIAYSLGNSNGKIKQFQTKCELLGKASNSVGLCGTVGLKDVWRPGLQGLKHSPPSWCIHCKAWGASSLYSREGRLGQKRRTSKVFKTTVPVAVSDHFLPVPQLIKICIFWQFYIKYLRWVFAAFYW